ncbi:CPBP family intramembrane metalloprotease [Mariniluteicoccus endophyticus]
MSGWRSIAAYVVGAYALAWLVALPLWLDPRHLASPWVMPALVLMMFTPLLATLGVRRLEGTPLRQVAAEVFAIRGDRGLTVGLAYAVGLILLVVLGGLATSVAFGTYTADLRDFSGLRAILEAQAHGQPMPPMPLGLLAVVSIVQTIPLGLVNTIPAMGEEVGWRGFLFPRLADRLGVWMAAVVSGVVWGCWHAPVILLGYNYPQGPRWLALLAMSATCTFIGVVFTWVRHVSRSTWAAAYGHGLFNALVGSSAMALSSASAPTDMRQGTVMGWGGWPVAAVVAVVVLLVLQRRARVSGGALEMEAVGPRR